LIPVFRAGPFFANFSLTPPFAESRESFCDEEVPFAPCTVLQASLPTYPFPPVPVFFFSDPAPGRLAKTLIALPSCRCTWSVCRFFLFGPCESLFFPLTLLSFRLKKGLNDQNSWSQFHSFFPFDSHAGFRTARVSAGNLSTVRDPPESFVHLPEPPPPVDFSPPKPSTCQSVPPPRSKFL